MSNEQQCPRCGSPSRRPSNPNDGLPFEVQTREDRISANCRDPWHDAGAEAKFAADTMQDTNALLGTACPRCGSTDFTQYGKLCQRQARAGHGAHGWHAADAPEQPVGGRGCACEDNCAESCCLDHSATGEYYYDETERFFVDRMGHELLTEEVAALLNAAPTGADAVSCPSCPHCANCPHDDGNHEVVCWGGGLTDAAATCPCTGFAPEHGATVTIAPQLVGYDAASGAGDALHRFNECYWVDPTPDDDGLWSVRDCHGETGVKCDTRERAERYTTEAALAGAPPEAAAKG